MRKYFIFFIAAVLLVAACSKSRVPADILPPEKMEDVLWDLMQADEFVKGYRIPYDSSLNDTAESIKLYKKVFEFNKTNRAEFDKSFAYYKVHTSLMKEVLDSLNVRAQKAPSELYTPTALEDSLAKQKIINNPLPFTDSAKKPVRPFKKPKQEY
jgi:hypothetical protein